MSRGIFVPSRPRARSRDENERLLRDQALLARVATAPTPDVILSLLTRGQSLSAIHTDGVRVLLTQNGLRLRLREFTGYGSPGLRAEIETDSGQPLAGCDWQSREPLYAFLERVGQALGQLGDGHYYGRVAVDQRELVDRIAEVFEVAITGSTLLDRGFRPLIEVLGPQWLLTGYGLECREVRFTVPAYAHADPRLRPEVSRRGWADVAEFDGAVAILGRLYAGRPDLFRGARALR